MDVLTRSFVALVKTAYAVDVKEGKTKFICRRLGMPQSRPGDSPKDHPISEKMKVPEHHEQIPVGADQPYPG